MRPHPPHVALTLALLGGGEGDEPLTGGILETADPALWRDTIAFASAHFVLPALAVPAEQLARSTGAVPADAIAFLNSCAEANADRNRQMLEALRQTGETLRAIGVAPIALKGAAFLTEECSPTCAAWRFMQDIDVLVPEDRLGACVEALLGLGFTAAKDDYDREREAHYPPLLSPCRTFSIEVHARLFAFGEHELSPDIVRNDARPSRALGASVLVPSPRHRLMHLLAHAQLHNRNYARRRIVLKDLADLAALEPATGPLEPCFADAHARAAAEALLAANSLASSDGSAWSPTARRWAEIALARLGWSRWRRLAATPFDLANIEMYRLRRERGHMKRRFALLSSPGRLTGARDALLTKQRQYLWQ